MHIIRSSKETQEKKEKKKYFSGGYIEQTEPRRKKGRYSPKG